MSYVIALLLDKQAQADCFTRAKYLQQCMKPTDTKHKPLYYIPLISIVKSKEIKVEDIKQSIDSVKGHSLYLTTAGISYIDNEMLVQLLKQDTGFKTMQRKLMRNTMKYTCLAQAITNFAYIPYLTGFDKKAKMHPRLWMKDQIPFAVLGATLVLLEKEKIIHQFTLPEETTQYVYILKCGDGSYYTGWTNDLEKRILAHQSGKGAKYTKSHQPVQLAYVETFSSKKQAMSQEYAYKQMSHQEKEILINKKTKIHR